MNLFKRQKPVVEKSKIQENDYSDLNGRISGNSFDQAQAELKDIFNYDDFQIGNGSEANYYGVEFDIQSTASRLKSLYPREPWVYATSDKIARMASSVPILVRDPKTKKQIKSHPVLDLLNKGNAVQDSLSMNWVTYLDLILTGNSFRVTDEKFKTMMVVPVENAQIAVKKTETEQDRQRVVETGPIQELVISNNGSSKLVRTNVPFERVIHFKLPNPFNPYYGMSPFTAGSRPVILDRYKNEFEMAFYHRGGTHSGVIETEKDVSKERMDRLMRTFEQTFTGKRNWWKQLFLPKGAKWKNSSLTMSEMQHLEGMRENRNSIMALLGIPPSQLGFVQDVNRATAEVQERILWTNTLQPFLWFIAAGWNNSYIIKEIYKGRVEVYPDFSDIEALQGSLVTKGEKAKSVEDYLVLNEIRTDILGYPPLKETDPRGMMLVAEIKKMSMNPFAENIPQDPSLIGPSDLEEKSMQTGTTEDGDGEDRHFHTAKWDRSNGNGQTMKTEGNGPDHVHDIESFKVLISGKDAHAHPDVSIKNNNPEKSFKAQAVESQNNIEDVQGRKYLAFLGGYFNMLLDQASYALNEEKDVASHLMSEKSDRTSYFIKNGVPIQIETMEKGFASSFYNTKSAFHIPHSNKIHDAIKIFSENDEQAVESIRERTSDGRRRLVAERSFDSFLGYDDTNTERVLSIIEDGINEGKSTSNIAETISKTYGERYGDQAFTIARTETLTAVSEGIAWNHEVLGKVFTEVKKQWFHVGDATILGGSNTDARNEHASFEQEGDAGVVPSGYLWKNATTGASLEYPRDPKAGASDNINCRCTMVSVVPESAQSMHESILI